MPTTNLTRGTATAVTLNLATLASSATDAGSGSDAIDCVTLDAVDIEIGGKITVGTTPTINTRIEVWLAPSYDGTSYAGGMTGTANAAASPVTPVGHKSMMRLVAVCPILATTSNITYTWGVPSVAAVFGGALPSKFVVFVTHNAVAALHATVGNHELKYRTIDYSSA